MFPQLPQLLLESCVLRPISVPTSTQSVVKECVAAETARILTLATVVRIDGCAVFVVT